MKITKHTIKVGDICEGYYNDVVNGVRGMNGKLNIRPQYQREFVYRDDQRDLVIDSIFKGYPLSVLYWAKNIDGTYEMIDGQQRTISICDYVMDSYSVDYRYWHNLTMDEQDEILNYEFDVYIGEGSEEELEDWFIRINNSGEKLNRQELRNAAVTGPWISDARRYFSKPNCPAQSMAKDYVNGKAIRQDFLASALLWISGNEDNIISYMKEHRFDNNAEALWNYFYNVIEWVKKTFPTYYKEMKSVEWGLLYNKFKDEELDIVDINYRISTLMDDSEITRKSGIFEYVLTGNENTLSIKDFDDRSKKNVYKKQNGNCACCGEHFEIADMIASHITPWRDGGLAEESNCQLVCRKCKKIYKI